MKEGRVVQGDHPVVRTVRRDLYDAMHPIGMHTNGPTRVQVEASHLAWLITVAERYADESRT